MTKYSKINVNTPQSKPITKKQIKNKAGGYVYEADRWTLLDRFLIMGVTGNTYYAQQTDLVRQNVSSIKDCIKEDGIRVVNRVLTIRRENRALKMEPLLFTAVLCMRYGDFGVRQLAHDSISELCGTFHMLTTLLNMREDLNLGWGRGLRRGVSRWYLNKDVDYLVYQAMKYPQRNSWEQRDLLRLCHVTTADTTRNAVFKWIVAKDRAEMTQVLHERHGLSLPLAVQDLRENPTPANAVALIKEHNLTREMLPTQLLTDAKVWEALNEKMPLWATVRNLGKMSKEGVISVLRGNDTIHAKLHDVGIIKRSRMHPMQFLIAQKVYGSGKSVKGSLSWTPSNSIVSSLEHAFYVAMTTMPPTGKGIMLGVDISGSMTSRRISDEIPFTPAEIAGTLSCVMAHVEPHTHVMGFASHFIPLPINGDTTIQGAMKAVQGSFGATDCALPMMYAMGFNSIGSSRFARKSSYGKTHEPIPDVDAFVVLTDNETWYGSVHPSQALADYRSKYNRNAKLIVIAMQAAGRAISIADPNDPNSLDVVGFDSAVPQLIQEFISD